MEKLFQTEKNRMRPHALLRPVTILRNSAAWHIKGSLRIQLWYSSVNKEKDEYIAHTED